MESQETSGGENAPVIIAEFEKNGSDVVRVMLDQYKGHDLLTMRVFYPDKATGEMRPAKGGLTIQQSRVGDLKKAIDAAAKAIKEGKRHAGDASDTDHAAGIA